jgi:hypothetical protein
MLGQNQHDKAPSPVRRVVVTMRHGSDKWASEGQTEENACRSDREVEVSFYALSVLKSCGIGSDTESLVEGFSFRGPKIVLQFVK